MAQYTLQNLSDCVQELLAFLQGIDHVLPDKVPEELTAWLKSLQDQPWNMELLLRALEQKRVSPPK
jgi:hypothetical protein